MTPISANASFFLDEEELALRDRRGLQERLAAWQEHSTRFSQHRNLLVYFDFQPSTDGVRSLSNRAINAAPGASAAIVGSDWVEGRWPGKGALDFKRSDDRVRMNVPGTFSSMTFLAWIQVDGLPNQINDIVSGDNAAHLGEAQWYVSDGGALGIGVRIASRGRYTQIWHAQSPTIFTEATLGTWTFVATVFDRAARKVTHFVNGRAVSSAPIDIDHLLELGMMEIGNRGREEGSRVPAVNFVGRIDEVAVLSTALTPADIRRAYEAGSPVEPKLPGAVVLNRVP